MDIAESKHEAEGHQDQLVWELEVALCLAMFSTLFSHEPKLLKIVFLKDAVKTNVKTMIIITLKQERALK